MPYKVWLLNHANEIFFIYSIKGFLKKRVYSCLWDSYMDFFHEIILLNIFFGKQVLKRVNYYRHYLTSYLKIAAAFPKSFSCAPSLVSVEIIFTSVPTFSASFSNSSIFSSSSVSDINKVSTVPIFRFFITSSTP